MCAVATPDEPYATQMLMKRNKMVFSNISLSPFDIVELLQLRSWKWLRSKDGGFGYDFYSWLTQPSMCLNFGN
ncbi:hypothetical protein SESBI_44705 [Sesbania bispinosa]|nr:hypothetical protein SESBI_44705 [Sesbania bispinosa]